MPNPKRRHSKTRRDKRRTHDGLATPQFSTCQQCGETKAPIGCALIAAVIGGGRLWKLRKAERFWSP